MPAMKYGRSLERLIRQVVISNPALIPVHVLKAGVSDGFYRIGLSLTYAPKMGLVFPLEKEDDKLLAIPLTLPIGWKKSPPYFSWR